MEFVLFPRGLVFSLAAMGALWGQPEISRPSRSWEFVDATNPRAGLFGDAQGTLEAFVYPPKILRDFHLIFHPGGREIPAWLAGSILGPPLTASSTIRPAPPADWRTFGVEGLRMASGALNLDVERDQSTLTLKVTNLGSRSVAFEFAPAYPRCARLTGVEVGGVAAKWETEQEAIDWHPRIRFDARLGTTRVVLRHEGFFGFTVARTPVWLAETSSNVKVFAEKWAEATRTLSVTVSGLAGTRYRLRLIGSDQLSSLGGARREGADEVVVEMPGGLAGAYVSQEVAFGLR